MLEGNRTRIDCLDHLEFNLLPGYSSTQVAKVV